MGVNPNLPPEQQKLALLRQISDSLQSISSNIAHEMGPFKVRPMVSPSDEMAEQWEKNKEANRREIEINELKRSNKIARLTTAIAVLALLISVLFGGIQVWLDWSRYQSERPIKNNSDNHPVDPRLSTNQEDKYEQN